MSVKNGANTAFEQQKGKGRPKGAQNKQTAAIKDMIINALDKAGGVDYLVEQSEKNPTAFMGLVGKVLPMQVVGDPDNPTKLIIETHVVHANR